MQKRLITCLLICFCFQLSWAQLSEEELRQEFDRMEEQMVQALKQLQATVENGQIFQLDTTIFRGFSFGGAEEPGFHPQGDPLQLQQLLDQFMGQFTEEDWAEIHRLFDEFQKELSSPDSGETTPTTPKKRNKKTKIYSL